MELKPWLKNYQLGVPATVDLTQYNSIPELLEECFVNYKDNPCFYNMGTTFTFGKIDLLSRKFASFLQHKLGMRPGDRIALMMPNILQYPVCVYGALRAGMTVVNVNPLYTARELEHQLCDSGATAIVIFANSASTLQKIVAQTKIRHIVVTEIGDLLKFPKNLVVNFVLKKVKKLVPDFSLPQSFQLKHVLASGDENKFNRPELTRDNLAFLQYTGGTTGVAKGAELTHANILANILQARAWLTPYITLGKEIIITPLPLYHIFSLTANCFIYCSVGSLNVLITNPKDIPAFIKELKNWKFTAITAVNTLFNALLNNPEFAKLDFSELKTSLGGGMAVLRPVAEKWKAITGKPLIEAYGLTETSPAVCINPLNIKDYNGFIGLPLPSTDVAIKDDDGNNVGFDVVGEICIQGPQVMRGYYNRQDETDKVMTPDNYFRTGDLGFMTQDGFVKIVDRKKDMILVSGFNVYPNEIEDVVMTHLKVFECAAIGVPDEKSNEAVKIFIVKKDDSLTSEEIIKFCRESLTSYKIPRHVEFRSDLPKSNVGKILRKDLRSK